MTRVRVRVTVGRQRAGGRISPFEAGYRADIQAQTKVIQDAIRSAIKGIEDVTPEAMIFGLQPAFDESQILVPVDTGVLKASGFLKAAKTPTGISVAMGYGLGGRPPYAAHVHERLDIPHKAPTQAKFLEAAANKHINKFLPRVVRHIRDATGIVQ